MFELLEEGFNLGLGVASVTVGKIEGMVKETLDKVGVKEGEDAKSLKDRLVNEGISAREKINDSLKKHLEKLEPLNSATTAKPDLILAKLEKIEAEIAKQK